MEESSSDALSWDTQNQENGLKEALTHQQENEKHAPGTLEDHSEKLQ